MLCPSLFVNRNCSTDAIDIRSVPKFGLEIILLDGMLGDFGQTLKGRFLTGFVFLQSLHQPVMLQTPPKTKTAHNHSEFCFASFNAQYLIHAARGLSIKIMKTSLLITTIADEKKKQLRHILGHIFKPIKKSDAAVPASISAHVRKSASVQSPCLPAD